MNPPRCTTNTRDGRYWVLRLYGVCAQSAIANTCDTRTNR